MTTNADDTSINGSIAYVAQDSSGNYQIYTISPDGNGSPTRVTSGGSPVWG